MSSKEEALLLSARHGKITELVDILKDEKVDVNCKGKQKSNLGWSPLHLAAYFGHQDCVIALLKHNADVNVINGMGDTPLHRAAFTGRQSVVLSLLHYDADVAVINAEGRTPLQMTDHQEVRKLIEAAEKSQQLSRNEALLRATTEGDTEKMKKLLGSPTPPNINYQNMLGNTALHCAAYRGHTEIAVLLLQNGIDSSVRNNRGLSALEVSRDQKMRQLLQVQPLLAVQKTVQRFEGYLLKKSRFLGWKKHWIVLERGILSGFASRADASSGLKRQFFKYLDNSKISSHQEDSKKFKVEYSDRTVHLYMTSANTGQVNRQRWLNMIREHGAYSTHYTSQPHIVLMDELDEDYLPLGSMEDALKNAKAHQQVLDQQVSSLSTYFNTLDDPQIRQGTATTLKMKLNDVVSTSTEVCSTLNHCLTILMQQEEVRRLQLQEEAEKRRVLEDALHILAREHFVLEQSVRSKAQSINGFSEDNDDFLDIFYDAPETLTASDAVDYKDVTNENITTDDEGLSSACGGQNDTTSTMTDGGTDSGSASTQDEGTPTMKKKTVKFRKKLPHRMHSSNQFSMWSVLKQAVGKDLSRLTMPVIFNEPLSFIQRLTEYMEYVDLLHQATKTDDRIQRLMLVTTYMISCNASAESRLGKPFNPLLGETFELTREDLDIKLIAEQVSHHPPVSALYCEGNSGFTLEMSMQPDLKFWGKEVEVKPKGQVIIKIPKYGDVYSFSYISSGIHNIIIGALWIELYGTCTITNHTTGDVAHVNFKPAGWFGKDINQVDGYITDKNDVKHVCIKGDWTKFVCSCPANVAGSLDNIQLSTKGDCESLPPEVTLNWTSVPKPNHASDMYMMTEFAMGLNELLDLHKGVIPPTDCRYRPDIRCMESGDIDGASSEKLRLEEKQRATRKVMQANNEKWNARWFSLEERDDVGITAWSYKGEYFKREFSECPDIY